MKWILLVIIHSYNHTSTAIVDFNTEEACNHAVAKIAQVYEDKGTSAVLFCLPNP